MVQTSENHHTLDPEWLRMFTIFLNENCDKKKFEMVKKIFVETYFENIRSGLNPKEAMEKAKTTALCFLIQLR
jgi:hypothetical protein